MKRLAFFALIFLVASLGFTNDTKLESSKNPLETQIIGMWCNMDSNILVDNERYEEMAEKEKPYFDFMKEHQYSFYWLDSKKEWGKYKILKDKIILYDRMTWSGRAFYEKVENVILSNVYIRDNKIFFNHPLETKALVITKDKKNTKTKKSGESMITPFLYKEKSIVMSRILDKTKIQYFRGKSISPYLLRECMQSERSAYLMRECIEKED